MSDRYQTIYLNLSDGRTIEAAVPEFCKVGDNLYLLPQLGASEPRPLPEGSYWDKLKQADDERPEVTG